MSVRQLKSEDCAAVKVPGTSSQHIALHDHGRFRQLTGLLDAAKVDMPPLKGMHKKQAIYRHRVVKQETYKACLSDRSQKQLTGVPGRQGR